MAERPKKPLAAKPGSQPPAAPAKAAADEASASNATVAAGAGQPAKAPANGNKPAPQVMGEEEAQKRAMASRMIAAAYGAIVSLYSRSPLHRNLTLGELDAAVATPVVRRQFAIADRTNPNSGAVAPVAVVLWAFVSPEVDARLSTSQDELLKLKADEWQSGDIAWIIDVTGDARSAGNILRELAGSVFKDRPPKMRARSDDGKFTVGILRPAAPAQDAAKNT